jgi:16S rRNA (cytidine1402-2'-O)-methyltransferase
MTPTPNLVTPGLYLVATPIGNLRDITLRALDVLAGVDVVLAEDTRVTGKLLAAHGIKTRLERYDEHAGPRVRPGVLKRLAEGAKIALVSDAGTPLVSDPGWRLVNEALAQGAAVIPIPGASAMLAALTVSGLPSDRFLFAGFPPPRAAGRRALFAELAEVPATLIFYEGASRLGECLTDMAAVFGPRPAVVARELTKLHETVVRRPLDVLAGDPALQAPKGEIVIAVAPPPPREADEEAVDVALRAALAEASPSEAAARVAKALGLPRRDLYARALVLKS